MGIIQLILRFGFLKIGLGVLSYLKFSTKGILCYGPFIFVLFFLGFEEGLVYFATFYFSIIICIYLPYVYGIPWLYGQKLTTDNVSKMMTAYAIGEATLTFMVRYLMDWFHPMVMFVYIFIIGLFLNYSFNNILM